MNRNLDGVYHRVERNGTYENICFSDLTDKEREAVCIDKSSDWYKSLAYHLADKIQEIGNRFNLFSCHKEEGLKMTEIKSDEFNKIKNVIEEAMEKGDRSISLYFWKDGSICMNIYPFGDDDNV